MIRPFATLLCLAPASAHDSSRELMRADPLVGRATGTSIEMNLLAGARPIAARVWLEADADAEGEREFSFTQLAAVDAGDEIVRFEGAPIAPEGAAQPAIVPAGLAGELRLGGLEPGTPYRWRLAVEEAAPGARTGAAVLRAERRGRFVTARPRGSTFTFAVFSDTHVFPAAIEPELVPEVTLDPGLLAYLLDHLKWYRSTRRRVSTEFGLVFARLQECRPDFTVSLGDVFDLHGRGFNWAFDSRELADAAHLEARRAMALLDRSGAIYQVLGNWEGESGCHPRMSRELARRARFTHAINPRPDTSPLGGGADEDYFAWEWGDALLIALNVRGYTPTPHHLGNDGHAEGEPDDFTLGPEQRAFLERTLAASDHPYKMTFIHHPVGGNGGNPFDSAYGRGGGRAARVGEQAWVHELCVKHGVQVFFYGHDHVFTDLEVDGVHYALPGTTSAPWRFTEAETGYERYWPESGFARVTVSPASLLVEFVSLRGDVLHQFESPPK